MNCEDMRSSLHSCAAPFPWADYAEIHDPALDDQPVRAFGCEYACRQDWSRWQRAFITVFGIVDLPSRIRARAVLWALQRFSCDHILDVGTGTGVYALYITRDAESRVLALDIDQRRIASVSDISGQLGRIGLTTLCGDDGVLSSLPRAYFSVGLAVEVLQYFPDLPRTLRDLHERLRPGGGLVVHIPVRKEFWPYERTLFDDATLPWLFINAGFEPPEIHQTFGRVALALGRVFSRCASRPAVLAIVYPLLLLGAALIPKFTNSGECRLVIARKPIPNSSTTPLLSE
ncbi:methyltransferase domain-containing protein [uncultured Thiodictyon sp.]|uniref:class I SAM-dependent methyltransferase n=1 Tax=uncultured Thiodictyon sp. TaxID=1846217 RepID=UPI0025EBDBEB|nr:methyltransferase domain-containing protein [uncultured Thiodictyon sp.]